jgi:hypothetical protein
MPDTSIIGNPDVKTIRLAGMDWPVPLLAPRQNRYIIPAILRVTPRLMGLGADPASGLLSVEDYAAALAIDEGTHLELEKIVYTALTRAHPKLTQEQFENMPISTRDMMVAMLTIGEQTGLLQRKPDQPGATPGEAVATGESS